MNIRAVLVIGLAGLMFPAVAQEKGSKHRIQVTFNYDFKHARACRAVDKNKKKSEKAVKEEKTCIRQFIVYDVSAGVEKRAKLMDIPVPAHAHGMVKGISGTTPLLLFEPGKHLISVVAQSGSGAESLANRCMVWVQVPATGASEKPAAKPQKSGAATAVNPPSSKSR